MFKNATANLKVRGEDCVGNNLCSIVCPVDDIINMVEIPNGDPNGLEPVSESYLTSSQQLIKYGG
jgi:Fe-S-cluster-containing hydrogenase component 2